MAEDGEVGGATSTEKYAENSEQGETSVHKAKGETFEISFGSEGEGPNLQEAFMKYKRKRQVSGRYSFVNKTTWPTFPGSKITQTFKRKYVV